MELKLHISAQDSCVGDGSVKKPFSSLEQARDAVREMRSSGKIPKDDAVTFIIHGGEYYLLFLTKETAALKMLLLFSVRRTVMR